MTRADRLDDDGVIALCAEMVLLMIDDYRESIIYMETHEPTDSKPYMHAAKTKREIERFVRSKFCNYMFDIYGKRLLSMALNGELQLTARPSISV